MQISQEDQKKYDKPLGLPISGIDVALTFKQGVLEQVKVWTSLAKYMVHWA